MGIKNTLNPKRNLCFANKRIFKFFIFKKEIQNFETRV